MPSHTEAEKAKNVKKKKASRSALVPGKSRGRKKLVG